MGKIYEGYKGKEKKDEVINGVKVHRCFEIGRRKGILFRFLNYYSFAWSSKRYAKKLKEKYGNDFVSIFTAGTCGDINHLNTSHVPWDEFRYREIGEIMANEVIRLIDGE
jgi:hypothetical protein